MISPPESRLNGLTKHYDLTFKDQKGRDPGLVYKAIAEKQVDVISGFATDGRIPAFNLVVLEDDLKFFLLPFMRLLWLEWTFLQRRQRSRIS